MVSLAEINISLATIITIAVMTTSRKWACTHS